MENLAIPLQQSPEFGRTCQAMGILMQRHSMSPAPGRDITWQVQSRCFSPLGQVDLISRGPVTSCSQDRWEWLRSWRNYHGDIPLLLNALDIPADALRQSGFWPLITASYTATLDLTTPNQMRTAMHQKWRNRLNRSEHEKINVNHYELADNHWLLDAERLQARTRRYRGFPPEVSLAFAAENPGQAIIFEARHDGDIIAAALFLRHGKMVTWQIGHSRPAGRRLNAMNLLLWRAMVWLQERGHTALDLGVLNSQDAAGMTHFKLGTGARIEQTSGCWLHWGVLAPFARHLPLWMAGIKKGSNVTSGEIAGEPRKMYNF